MSTTSTILAFVLAPAAIAGVIAALALAGGDGRRGRRYRPGRPYDFTPIWFLSAPEQVSAGAALTGRGQRPALDSGAVETGGGVPSGVTGGASDHW